MIASAVPASSGVITQFPVRQTSPSKDGTVGRPIDKERGEYSGGRIRRGFFGLGGSLSILGLMLVLFVGDSSSIRIYKTDIGEQQNVYLANGTIAVLNTNSELQAICDGTKCDVDLLNGEALINTEKTKSRLSRVSIGDVQISGTQGSFNARITEDGEVQVTVADGNALVSSPYFHQTLIQRGQRVVFRHFGDAERTRIDNRSEPELRRELSWQTGELEFDNDALGTAVSEINRYNRVNIELIGIFDEEQVSGRFSSTDPYSFARSISRVYRDVRLEIDDTIPEHRVLRLTHLATSGKLHRENHPQCERNTDGTSPRSQCSIHRLSHSRRLGTV